MDTCKSFEKAASQNLVLSRQEVHKVHTSTKPSSDLQKRNRKYIQKCKFCGTAHEMNKLKCPAFGKNCLICGGRNHFSKVCKSRNKVNFLNNTKDSESECSEWINSIGSKDRQVKCAMKVKNKTVNFQIDTGSSVNILPVQFVNSEDIRNTETTLKTWNNNKYEPIGECRIVIQNPKNLSKYNVSFVIRHEEFTPILGFSASQQMKLLEIKHSNFEKVCKLEFTGFPPVKRQLRCLTDSLVDGISRDCNRSL